MNTFFKNNDGRKRRKYDPDIHKDMRATDKGFQTNKKLFVTVHPKITCKLELADHLWLPFIDQPWLDVVVFAINNFQIYNILGTK